MHGVDGSLGRERNPGHERLGKWQDIVVYAENRNALEKNLSLRCRFDITGRTLVDDGERYEQIKPRAVFVSEFARHLLVGRRHEQSGRTRCEVTQNRSFDVNGRFHYTRSTISEWAIQQLPR